MKKLVLTLALVFGVLAANAQYFVGGQLGLLYDDASENTMITIAPEYRSVCPLEFLEERFCRLIGRWWFRYFYSKV